MANSKTRCNSCRNYFSTNTMYKTGLGGFGGVCSEDCYEAYLEKYRNKRARRKIHREMRFQNTPGRIPGGVRETVRRRDNDKCQWCGALEELQIHHVRYRSEGGPDNQRNLITLCADHHALAHANKKKYQPVLLLWLWLHYELDFRKHTVPATFRHAGLHPNEVDEARRFSDMVMGEKKSELQREEGSGGDGLDVSSDSRPEAAVTSSGHSDAAAVESRTGA